MHARLRRLETPHYECKENSFLQWPINFSGPGSSYETLGAPASFKADQVKQCEENGVGEPGEVSTFAADP